MQLPEPNMRMVLKAGITAVEVEEKWIPAVDLGISEEDDGILTEVTIIARDLDEGVWTVWDHSSRSLKLVTFDENGIWSWVEVADDIVEDRN